jgi:hypothetical protein
MKWWLRDCKKSVLISVTTPLILGNLSNIHIYYSKIAKIDKNKI